MKESKEKKVVLPPAMSEEAREKQMIALAVDSVEERMRTGKASASEYVYYLKQYVGRPSPLYYAGNLSKYVGGAKIYLKRESLVKSGRFFSPKMLLFASFW